MFILSLLVTILVVCVLCWFAFLAIDYFVAAFPPRNPPSPPSPFNIGNLAKCVVVVAALMVICSAAFGSHRFLIPVHGF